MNKAQRDYMAGWTLAARAVKEGYSESECQALCAYLPSGVDSPDKWRGFTAAMLSGYHEVTL